MSSNTPSASPDQYDTGDALSVRTDPHSGYGLQKDEAIGTRFIDNISHEFRTPLAVVKEYASLLHDGLLGDPNSEQSEFVSIIGDRADDLANIVDDLLESSRADAGLISIHRSETTLAQVVGRVRNTLEQKTGVRNIELALDYPDSLSSIYTDQDKTARILVNLVVNGIKYTDEGGQIRIWAKPHRDGHSLKICVSNTGMGFDDEEVEGITRRFRDVSARPNSRTVGFGLGLNIANEFVDMCFGQMSLESIVGEGNTFSFTVPLATLQDVCRCYQSRVARLYGETSLISRLTVRVAADSTDQQTAELQSQIESVFSKSDLVWRLRPNVWMVLAQTGDVDVRDIDSQLRAAVTATNANRPSGLIPCPEVLFEEECLSTDNEVAVRALQVTE